MGLEEPVRRALARKLVEEHGEGLERLALEGHPDSRIGGREEIAFVRVVEAAQGEIGGNADASFPKQRGGVEGEQVAGGAEGVEVAARDEPSFVQKGGDRFPAGVPRRIQAGQPIVVGDARFLQGVAVGAIAVLRRGVGLWAADIGDPAAFMAFYEVSQELAHSRVGVDVHYGLVADLEAERDEGDIHFGEKEGLDLRFGGEAAQGRRPADGPVEGFGIDQLENAVAHVLVLVMAGKAAAGEDIEGAVAALALGEEFGPDFRGGSRMDRGEHEGEAFLSLGVVAGAHGDSP